jgi:hypothetical protein
MPTNHRNEQVGDNHLNEIAFTASVVKSMPTYLNPTTYSHSIVAEAMEDHEMHKMFGRGPDGSPATREQIIKNVERYHGYTDEMHRDQFTHNTDIDMPDRDNPSGMAHYYGEG